MICNQEGDTELQTGSSTEQNSLADGGMIPYALDMISVDEGRSTPSLAEQRALWRRQTDSSPSLHGGKRAWFPLVVDLVDQVAADKATVMESRPILPGALFERTDDTGGAAPSTDALTWAEYGRFLRSVGFAQSNRGHLELTTTGRYFQAEPTPENLGIALAGSFRLFAESLDFFWTSPSTVEDLDRYLRDEYETSWKSLAGTRSRVDWLDALGLIEGSGSRRWRVTEAGESLKGRLPIVSPEAIAISQVADSVAPKAPPAIELLLGELATGARSHDSRNTYNIWVPSPATHSNKVENLRAIINATLEPISKEDLLEFIADTFTLRRSSVDSMMPFLRASGLLQEIGMGIYEATEPARAWIASGEDINFIRILHANMRFVGEMVSAVATVTSRPDMYQASTKHGLNVDKSRWIASFLEDTGLIEKPRYGHLRATRLGLALLAELPLAETPSSSEFERSQSTEPISPHQRPLASFTEQLSALSRSPHAHGLGSGKAFEYAVRDVFRLLGFNAQSISGPGDTDILVKWTDDGGNTVVAIVEVKSRSNGQVAHTDISDVALETHKNLHKADFVAVVGPAFVGDTIKNMAAARNWALVDAQQLEDLAEASIELGLNPATIGLLFKAPTGIDELQEIVDNRRRELAVVSFVVSQLVNEAADAGDAITARDISRDARKTELQPTIDEVLNALALLTNKAGTAVRQVQGHEDNKFSTYRLGDVRSAAWGLRALADAIESASPAM